MGDSRSGLWGFGASELQSSDDDPSGRSGGIPLGAPLRAPLRIPLGIPLGAGGPPSSSEERDSPPREREISSGPGSGSRSGSRTSGERSSSAGRRSLSVGERSSAAGEPSPQEVCCHPRAFELERIRDFELSSFLALEMSKLCVFRPLELQSSDDDPSGSSSGIPLGGPARGPARDPAQDPARDPALGAPAQGTPARGPPSSSQERDSPPRERDPPLQKGDLSPQERHPPPREIFSYWRSAAAHELSRSSAFQRSSFSVLETFKALGF